MSENPEPQRKSQSWTLAVVLVLAVPLLYLLSVPWVAQWDFIPLKAQRFYVGPFNWLGEHTPLKPVLSWYVDWCLELGRRWWR